MKTNTFFCLALLLLWQQSAIANDTSIAMVGGVPRMQNEPYIHMRSEKLIFSYIPSQTRKTRDGKNCQRDKQGYLTNCPPGWKCYDETPQQCTAPERWQANLTYVFENVGSARQLTMGLPFRMPTCPENGSEYHGPDACEAIENLTTTVDGQKVAMSQQDNQMPEDGLFNRVYTFPVTFKPKQIRTIRHSYISYDNHGIGGQQYRYLLKTGAPWAGPIGQVEVDFELPADNGPCAVVNLPHTRQGNKLHVQLKNWHPDRDLGIVFAKRSRLFVGEIFPEQELAEEVCASSVNGSAAERHLLAAQIELLYGAPHTAFHKQALAEGIIPLCRRAELFAAILEKDEWLMPHVGLGQLRFMPDPQYPNNMSPALKGCMRLLKRP